MKVVLGVTLIVVVLSLPAIGYVKNIVKLTQCDFEAPYKAECVHAAGLVPIVGAVTGWMDFGK